jgi:hypothetical protein
MAQYLILLYQGEAGQESASEEALNEMYQAHRAFSEVNKAALRGGNALQPTGTATSVRKDVAGTFVVTDGPFAETKEALGGYYLVEAADLDEAIAIAKQVPGVPGDGGVEVRPIRTFD